MSRIWVNFIWTPKGKENERALNGKDGERSADGHYLKPLQPLIAAAIMEQRDGD